MMGQTLVSKRWFSVLTRCRVITHIEDNFNYSFFFSSIVLYFSCNCVFVLVCYWVIFEFVGTFIIHSARLRSCLQRKYVAASMEYILLRFHPIIGP